MEPVRESVIDLVKEEIEAMQPEAVNELIAVNSLIPAETEKDSFWGTFEKQLDTPQNELGTLDSEISMWGGLSAPSRTANPMHVMTALKGDYPRIYKLFRKISIIPSSQNKDERLFSMVSRNTNPLCRSIKPETIERKVVVGSAIQKHGFVFNYMLGNDSSSSDEADSFWIIIIMF